MKVRATKLGFYDVKRRQPGDVFVLHDSKLFSEEWMEKVDKKVPKQVEESEFVAHEPEVSSEDDVI